jgi:GH15 family glucan-1,4-alpha-glucosidase
VIKLVEGLDALWPQPDEGIWEVRGSRQHFTHSKVLAWVAYDRAVKSVEQLGLDGNVDHWRQQRDAIHVEVCREAYNPRRGAFMQSYGSDALDASVLLLPLVGFIDPRDPRMTGTVAAIERELMRDGLVLRYETGRPADGETAGAVPGIVPTSDGLPAGEGAFLACSFWLADNYVLSGRFEEAERLFERLVGLANDVGLLAEQYDPRAQRQLGNVPQAFSHLSLVNTAYNLSREGQRPAEHRRT